MSAAIRKYVVKMLFTMFYIASFSGTALAADMNDYCILPPFVAQSIPPMVMFDIGREHKLYYEAYNDSSDLDEDDRIDNTYKHTIDYYGYFDSYKCYTYDTTGTDKFVPAATTADKFCSTSQWSGNVLNWLSMSRMDVLRKVLYGGYRSSDSSTTVLERVYIPQDAHSFGKEFSGRLCRSATSPYTYTNTCETASDCVTGYTCVDKSQNLIGMAAADEGVDCSVTSDLTWDESNQKILVVKYQHVDLDDTIECGDDHDLLMSSYDPSQYLQHFYLNTFDVNDGVNNPPQDTLTTKDHGDYFNFFAVTEFRVTKSNKGNWQFAIDGDEGVELEIAQSGSTGTVVASYYGCHNPTEDQTHSGTINLASSGWYRLIVRHTEKGVGATNGVRVWYKKPSDAGWTIFGNSLTLRAPVITATNVCTVKTADFIETGKPSKGTVPKRHLFCGTTLSDGGAPVLRMLSNKSNRIWEWASKERPVCDTSLGTPTDYDVRVQVCTDVTPDNRPVGKRDVDESGKEPNCRVYGTDYKPAGLLQKYGERIGTAKVCSRTMSKSCNSNSDCSLATEGICVEKALMYFGLMTDSYIKNLSGGVLRKNIAPISDETQTNGYFQSAESERGNLVITMDRMKTVGFRYSDHSYQDSSGGTCGWITDRPLAEGECRMWGNPIAEMMYETIRYFAGKGAPTSDFTYSTAADSTLNLSKPAWGYKSGSDTYQVYDIFPSCAKPFMLVLSDVNTSYDGDQVPGSSYLKTGFVEDAANPQLGLATTDATGTSYINQLMKTIGSTESITDNTWFIGENGALNDFICSSKTASTFSLLRGICPEEPTKKGTFYAAALAYYGHSKLKAKTGKPDISTFVVALSSPFPDIRIKAGSSYVTVVPFGKSVSGGSNVYQSCVQKCPETKDDNGLHLGNCNSDAYCPTNQLVDFYVEDIRYDSSTNNAIYAKYRINFEDVEQGADHDMDAIVSYEICTQDAINQSLGSCGGVDLSGGKVQVKVGSEYGAGGIDQVLGFVISGTTEDGSYLVVKDKDVSSTDGDTPATVSGLPLTWSNDFSPSGTPAGILKSPLWYAAKWGGFEDRNGNDLPDQLTEWDKDNSGDPDNYFLAVNPLKLETQLDKALTAILARVSSGTAASILSNNDNNGANLLQAVFYPKKIYGDVEVSWIGELQGLWYYIDPFLRTSSIREDTDSDKKLKLKKDNVTHFFFDTSVNQTRVSIFNDSDGNGSGDTFVSTVDPDSVKSLWKAGYSLFQRDISSVPRTIKTYLSGSSFTDFTTGNAATLQPYLGAADATAASNLISWVRGSDVSGLRGRTITIGSGAFAQTSVWRLGDIVSSTPKLQSSVKLQSYDSSTGLGGYQDSSYAEFIASYDYTHRGMAYAGANDGMLHAFNLGVFSKGASNTDEVSVITGTDLGKEMWAYIPKNSLPYLQYLADPTYSHLYYVDATPFLIDASIATTVVDVGCSDTTYWNCPKQTTYSNATTKTLDLSDGKTSWRTVIIGGMGLGGASKSSDDACTDDASGTCVKAPLSTVGYTDIGRSSYFALDITNPNSPQFMWEFSDPSLGYSLVGPAVVRVGDTDKNGRWYAVFASGPTGPINKSTHQFMGTSNQNLKIFILDLRTGTLLRTIDTGIANAFAGSLLYGTLDTDRFAPTRAGNYTDDVIHVGYVKKDTTTNTWTKGGILRIDTRDGQYTSTTIENPTNWNVSTVIDDIGPVTSGIAKLIDQNKKILWLYFGTGRFYYKSGNVVDAQDNQQALYGIKEPCYTSAFDNDFDSSNVICTTSINASSLADQTDPDAADQKTAAQIESSSYNGWKINLANSTATFGAQRVVTDAVAANNGVVFFTAFKPSTDVCSFGGNSSIWAVSYNSGGALLQNLKKGQILVQVSTGSFEEIQMSSAFTGSGGRESYDFQGVPPKAPPSIVSNAGMTPIKKILHIQER